MVLFASMGVALGVNDFGPLGLILLRVRQAPSYVIQCAAAYSIEKQKAEWKCKGGHKQRGLGFHSCSYVRSVVYTPLVAGKQQTILYPCMPQKRGGEQEAPAGT